MKSFVLIGVLICLGCFIAGCGYSSSGSNYGGGQNTLSLTGNWQFTYTSSKPGSSPSTISGTLTQNGNSFSATVTITGTSPCATSATFSGTLSGYALTGTLTATNLETISVTGTVATDYNSAMGTYRVMSAMGACMSASGDSGTWTGKRITSGIYGGMLMSADRIPAQITLSLKSDSSQQVSGTATFTTSACLGSMTVAGTLSGANLELKSEGGSDSSVVLTGTFNEEGKALTLKSAISGPCQAESGAGTLTKMQ